MQQTAAVAAKIQLLRSDVTEVESLPARTTLITLTLLGPTSVNSTLNSSFSSAAADADSEADVQMTAETTVVFGSS